MDIRTRKLLGRIVVSAILCICLTISTVLVFIYGISVDDRQTLLSLGMDVIGIIILAVIFVSLIINKGTTKGEAILISVVISEILTLTFDILFWGGAANQNMRTYQMIGGYLEDVTLLLTVVAGWPFFLVLHKISKRAIRIGDLAIVALTILALALIVSNIFTGYLFEFDASGSHEYNNAFVLFIVITLVTFVEAVYSAYYNEGLRNKVMGGVFSFVLFSFLTLIQYADPKLSFIYLGPLVVIFNIYVNFYVAQMEKRQYLDHYTADEKYKSMMAQIQPHFIYNLLTSIVSTPGMPDATKEALFTYSRFLRETLDSAAQLHPVPIRIELQHIESYLELENVRMGGRLRYRIDPGDGNFPIPMLVLQLVIENSIVHGIAPKSDGGTIEITARAVDGGHVITVSDDGVGFDVDTLAVKAGGNHGLDIVRSRLEKYVGGTILITSIVGKGTTAEIFIPRYRPEVGRS